MPSKRVVRILEIIECILGMDEHHQRHHRAQDSVRFYYRAIEGDITLMPASITAATGQSFSVTLVSVPAGSKFTGPVTLVSSDPSVVAIVDNGDGTGTATVVGANGATAAITGTDTGTGNSDFGSVIVADVSVIAQSGVSLSFGAAA